MKKLLILSLLAAASAASLAKLPALSDEAKAKAAETAAKTAWTGKVEAYQLCKSQDKVAASYYKSAKAAGKETKPAAAAPLAPTRARSPTPRPKPNRPKRRARIHLQVRPPARPAPSSPMRSATPPRSPEPRSDVFASQKADSARGRLFCCSLASCPPRPRPFPVSPTPRRR